MLERPFRRGGILQHVRVDREQGSVRMKKSSGAWFPCASSTSETLSNELLRGTSGYIFYIFRQGDVEKEDAEGIRSNSRCAAEAAAR